MTFDGQWFSEEYGGSSRLSLRVEALLHEETSDYQKLSVYDTPFFGKVLTLDDCIMLTERDEFVYHEMLIHVPLALHPEPRSVLIIGGGDCGCAREALRHGTVERVVQCDIDERVTRVCADHFEWPNGVEQDPRVELVFADGIRYVEEHPARFDVIVIDSTDPVGPAVGLFQEPFYRQVSRALRPGGVMTAQTESPHWGSRMVGEIFEQIGRVFEHVSPYLGAIPTYPSGLWSWALASDAIQAHGPIDEERARKVAEACRYYTTEIQRAAFVLPRFVERAVAGDDPFEGFRGGPSASPT